jgi:hypothetical protein
MGLPFPNTPEQGGDNEAVAPYSNSRSILGSERGSNKAKRLETDTNNNLYVVLGAGGASQNVNVISLKAIDPLSTGTATGILASTLTTLTTYSPVTNKVITRIAVSGTRYAKYQLFLNTALIETQRTGPDRNLAFIFEPFPLALNATDILDVKVTHYNTGETADFEATVYGG